MTSQKKTISGRLPPHAEQQEDPSIDVRRFWSAGEDLNDIETPPSSETPPALNRLGALSVPGSRFPLLGFFATVYDHVSSHVLAMTDRPENRNID